ncbi:hypothetical protein BGZ61DRAFT_487847 [Ilyonectria robusta]|uniref:uncharacterized protein n=1 Tax=Ilyonectria robusta TaxID=1079257 RepID=UPI001E8EA272|nr:uncharacterized protein BGZ61DRAFT_487847 [Ilyonectria robusta]KAH8650452.1 hypothetical protein BGZ61DRAFT_487847 [Ilyonectria robusta]
MTTVSVRLRLTTTGVRVTRPAPESAGAGILPPAKSGDVDAQAGTEKPSGNEHWSKENGVRLPKQAERFVHGQSRMDWQDKDLLVIDEVSMLGARTLHAMNEQVCRLRGSQGAEGRHDALCLEERKLLCLDELVPKGSSFRALLAVQKCLSERKVLSSAPSFARSLWNVPPSSTPLPPTWSPHTCDLQH